MSTLWRYLCGGENWPSLLEVTTRALVGCAQSGLKWIEVTKDFYFHVRPLFQYLATSAYPLNSTGLLLYHWNMT